MNTSYSGLDPVASSAYISRRWLKRRKSKFRSRLAAGAILVGGLSLAMVFASILPDESSDDYGPNDIAAQYQDLALPGLPEGEVSPLATGAVPAGHKAGGKFALSHGQLESPTPPATGPLRRTVRLERGDTLIGLLMDLAVPQAEAHMALNALRTVYNPKDMNAGSEVTVLFDGAGAFDGFAFDSSAEQSITVQRKGEGYAAAAKKHPLTLSTMAANVQVEGSLYESGVKSGIPAAAMASLTKVLSYNVDFQRDIKLGDSFRVIYDELHNPDGQLVRTGDIAYAELILNDRVVKVYRFKQANGDYDYFDENGRTLKRSLLRTPVNAARMTSGFGMRRHPILGYSKMHRGVDFGAPTGTPIYAAGDGVIVERAYKGAYGNYVRIRHTGDMSTAYAHMSRFANGVQKGSRVKQGQVIGYVGTTGRSTGPHLHYEILVGGVQVNPLKVANVSLTEPLKGGDLARFKAMQASIKNGFEHINVGAPVSVSFNAVPGKLTQVALKQQVISAKPETTPKTELQLQPVAATVPMPATKPMAAAAEVPMAYTPLPARKPDIAPQRISSIEQPSRHPLR